MPLHPMGPPPFGGFDENRPPKPKQIRDIPRYLSQLFSGFFSRLFYVFRLVWKTRPWILFAMLFMAVFNGIMPVLNAQIGARLLNSLADAYVGKAAFQTVMGLLILQFAYLFVNSLIQNVYTILNRIGGELVTNHIKQKIMNKAKEVDLASFDRPGFYEKLENANREAGQRPTQIIGSTFSIVSTIISMVSFVVILWAISPFAPFLIVIISVPSAIINFVYRKKNVNYMRRRSKDRRQMTYFSNLMVDKDMVKEIRLFALSDELVQRYHSVFLRYFAGLKKLIVQEGVWHIVLTVLSNLVNCGLFLYVAKGVCDGTVPVGDYALYTGALNQISLGVASLIGTTATIYEGTLFIDNMISFMKEKKTIVPLLPDPLPLSRKKGHSIVFEHVSFRYPGTVRNVLEDINLTLNPGETAVLVGLNGAGKTTLIKLLTRLYDPTEGTIYLDGQDIRAYQVEELYKLFGIIFQDFGKYAVSVAQNISFGDLSKKETREGVVQAARQGNAESFIDRLPNGYDTPLMRIFEENGVEPSIGQWQKLSISRAFYSDSDILILDEPTAALDPLAEQEIFNQFDALRQDKTTIFVSHRLSSATTASKIIVLENGRILELGSHRELMRQKGRYYELFHTQAKRYVTPEEDAAPSAAT